MGNKKLDLKEGLEKRSHLLLYEWAIHYMEMKIRMIDAELSDIHQRPIMMKMEHRIKSVDSIQKKLQRKGYEINYQSAVEHLNDIVGVRVICLYTDDVYRIGECIKEQKDLKLVKEKDYIKKPKKSGYQSYHLILDVPYTYKNRQGYQRAEVQVRTVAMDFWAGVDNQMCYKKSGEKSNQAENELKNYSGIISKIDREMLLLRRKMEA